MCGHPAICCVLNILFGFQAVEAYSATRYKNNLNQGNISKSENIIFKKPWHIFTAASTQFCTVPSQTSPFLLCHIKLMQCVQKAVKYQQKCKDTPSMSTIGFPSDQWKFPQCSPSKYYRKQHLFKPCGQECLEVYYPYHTPPLISFDQSKKKSHNVRGIVHTFDVNPLFGLNLTFLVFSLSGLCEISKHYLCKAQNELLFIQQTKDLLNFVFCKTRAPWSVFLKNTVVVMFKTCNYSCEYCYKKNSLLKYSYQVMSAEVFQTHTDYSHQVLNRAGQTQFSNISYRILERVHKFEQHYFLNGKKFEHTLLVLPKDNTKSLLDFKFKAPLNQIFQKGHQFKIHYFYCHFLILQSAEADLQTSMTFLFTRVLQQTSNSPQDGTYNVLVSNMPSKFGGIFYQKSFHFNTSTNTFIKVDVRDFKYVGPNSCFHSGMSFFDGTQKKEIWTICSEIPFMATKTSYTAASNTTEVVVFFSFGGLLNISLAVSHSSCRGIFINSCSRKAYLAKFISTKQAPKRLFGFIYDVTFVYSDTHLYPNETGQCVSFHLGSQYLRGNRQERDCVLVFYFTSNLRTLKKASWCYFKLIYTNSVFERYPWSWKTMTKVFVIKPGEDLLFKNFVVNSSYPVQYYKDDNCIKKVATYDAPHGNPENWFFNTNPLSSQYQIPHIGSSQTHNFEATIEFGALEQSKHQDRFFMRYYELTSYPTVLTIRLQACSGQDSTSEKLNLGPFHIGGTMLICLTKTLTQTSVVKMSHKAFVKGALTKCVLGRMKFYLGACIDILTLFIFLHTFPFDFGDLGEQICVNTRNPDWIKVVWTLNLTSLLFLLNDQQVEIDLHGKLLAAELDLLGGQCCLKPPCFLELLWEKQKNIVYYHPTAKDGHFTDWITKVQKFLLHEEYSLIMDEPIDQHNGHQLLRIWKKGKKTWHEANKTCVDKSSHLPSFTSHTEVGKVLAFLEKVSLDTLVSEIFIGLLLKVIMKTCGLLQKVTMKTCNHLQLDPYSGDQTRQLLWLNIVEQKRSWLKL